jgi:pimeloyl-ACP methyl ester carboxylesterase
MHVEVNGTRLWFDVDGPVLEPVDVEELERPTVVLVHGGPGVYDHSYFKPHFAVLAEHAQVVYLDLRDHGRSTWATRQHGASRPVPTTFAAFATRSGSRSRSSSDIRWAARSFCSTGRDTLDTRPD